MSRYEVDKLLRDLRRDEGMAAHFRSDIESVLDRYKLDAAEREPGTFAKCMTAASIRCCFCSRMAPRASACRITPR